MYSDYLINFRQHVNRNYQGAPKKMKNESTKNMKITLENKFDF